MDEQQLMGEGQGQKVASSDRIAFTALMVAIFGGILFLVPGVPLPLDIGRGFIFSLGISASLLFWLFARMKEGRFLFPRSILLASMGSIVVAVLLAAFFSEVPSVSFMGLGGELGTFATVASFAVAAFLASIFFQSRRRMLYLYGGILVSALLVFLYQIVAVLMQMGKIPSLPIPDHLVGKWSDLAIFFGLTLVLSLATLETLPLGKFLRRSLITLFVISTLVLVLASFTTVWVLVGIFALIVFVYALSFGRHGLRPGESEKGVPMFSLSVIFLSLAFSIFGTYIANTLVTRGVFIPQRVMEESVRPSWQGTVQVGGQTLAHDPVFGVGPGRFVQSWLLYKPDGVNQTPLWDANFDQGIGAVPTFAATTGAVGTIMWLVFLILFLYVGFRAMLLVSLDRVHHYLITSSFLSALYLWIFATLFVPSLILFALAFVFTGVFVASLVRSGVLKNYDFSFLGDPRAGFISVFVLITLFVGTFTGGALLTKRFLSFVYYQSAATKAGSGDIQGAEVQIQNALRLGNADLYYRAGADIKIAQAKALLSSPEAKSSQAQFSAIAQDINTRALGAVAADPTNYLNHLSLARAYAALFPILSDTERAKAHDLALQSYAAAQKLNPASPAIALEQARMEAGLGNMEGAKKWIADALNKKGNYTEAIFLLAQIQASEGKLDDAIQSAEVAAVVAPNDIGVFFELGLLKYKNGDYTGAIIALEHAVILNPYYANAKYYLGLSYNKAGRRSDAIAQFKDIALLNPDNAEVKSILAGWMGNSTESTVNIDKQEKDRTTLPLKERR